MCQIIPFTLPCCRRVYVEVSKLPSCPNSWPNRKCPPELCIQVRGYEADDRDVGSCWRCKANSSGASGHDREALRPKIDKASLVLGLEEIGVSGRRRKTERDGECWFCGARGGCQTCGAREFEKDEGPRFKVENTGLKKRTREPEAGKGKAKEAPNKRLKIEPRGQKLPASVYEYPDPDVALKWAEPYPQVYNNHPRDDNQGVEGNSQEPQVYQQQSLNFYRDYEADDFSSDGLPLIVGTTQFEASGLGQPYTRNWRAVNNQQRDPLGLLNDNVDLLQLERSQGNRAQVDFKLQQQYHVTDQLPCPSSSPHRDLHQSIEAESLNTNTGQRQSSQLMNSGGQVDFEPHHYPIDETLPRLSQGTCRPSSTDTRQQQFRQFDNIRPQADFQPQQNGPYDYATHSNLDTVGQHYRTSNPESRNDFRPQQYYRNEYNLCIHPGINPALLQRAGQQNTAMGHAAIIDAQDELRNFMNSRLQSEFDPQQYSKEHGSCPDQNIQPGLQDVSPSFDCATTNNATLAQEVENHGFHKPAEQIATISRPDMSEQGPSNAAQQAQYPS